MKTKLTRSPVVAARFIQEAELVAFPTETVYGLGANLFDENALGKVFKAKGRPADNPLIAHISDLNQLRLIAKRINRTAEKLINNFFPGPITLVLRKRKRVPLLATAGLETIGVRMPRDAVAQEFLEACGTPVAAPSANISGRPSPTTWRAVKADMDGRIACILQGDQTEVGLESTVVDCTGTLPLILRAGAITLEQLQSVVPNIAVAQHDNAAPAKSPGAKYRHYSPQASVKLVAQADEAVPDKDTAYIGLDQPHQPANFKWCKVCASAQDYAHSLFHFFRQCDEALVKTIYCQTIEETGLGLALMDRLNRAKESKKAKGKRQK